MLLQRQKVPEGSASAKALDYSLKRWTALTQLLQRSNEVGAQAIEPLCVAYMSAASSLPSLRDCATALRDVWGQEAASAVLLLLRAIEARGAAQPQAYRQNIDDAVTVLAGGSYAAPTQPVVEETLRQLRRLRDDLDLALWLSPRAMS